MLTTQPPAPLAAGLAGATAAAAYIDAKFHISKDVSGIRAQRANARALEKTGTPSLHITPHTTHTTNPAQRQVKAPLSGTSSKPKSPASPPRHKPSGRAPAATHGPKRTRTHVGMRSFCCARA
jgi:hypothetical protein